MQAASYAFVSTIVTQMLSTRFSSESGSREVIFMKGKAIFNLRMASCSSLGRHYE